jgi:hypothetical protein
MFLGAGHTSGIYSFAFTPDSSRMATVSKVSHKRGGAVGWAGLGWAGLGWAGLGWAGLGWAGLGWAGLGWAGLG